MISTSEKIVRIKNSNIDTVVLVKKLYDLRKEFEAGYTGKLRSHKYEETREFTISLNFAIFQANQLLNTQEVGFTQKTKELETKLQTLKRNWSYLKL